MLFLAPATLPADDLSYDQYRPIHHRPPSRDRPVDAARRAEALEGPYPARARLPPARPPLRLLAPPARRETGSGTRPGPDRRPAPPHHRGRMRQAPAIRIGGPRPGSTCPSARSTIGSSPRPRRPSRSRRTDPGGAGFGRLDQRALAAAAALRVWDGLCPAHGPSCPDILTQPTRR